MLYRRCPEQRSLFSRCTSRALPYSLRAGHPVFLRAPVRFWQGLQASAPGGLRLLPGSRHRAEMDERIQAAKNLLCEEKLSIEQIANYLDFSSQSHFTAVFRKAVGTTPAIWRKEHKESNFEISTPDTEKRCGNWYNGSG